MILVVMSYFFCFLTDIKKGEEGSPTSSPSEEPNKTGKNTGLSPIIPGKKNRGT